MPYRTEHSIRYRRPIKGARYASHPITTGVRAVLMDGDVQALRFKIDRFSAEDAKKWARDHGWGDWLKFEKARQNPMSRKNHAPFYKSGDRLYKEAEDIAAEMLKQAGVPLTKEAIRLMTRAYYQGWLACEEYYQVKAF